MRVETIETVWLTVDEEKFGGDDDCFEGKKASQEVFIVYPDLAKSS